MEKWIKWSPVSIEKGSYVVDELVQNTKHTKIVLRKEEMLVEILFNGIVLGLRNVDEGQRINTIMANQKLQNDRYYFSDWPFYKVENSSFASWLEKESCGIYTVDEIIHIVIVTIDDVIDILTTYEPDIKVIHS
ncbi:MULTISPECIES: hypothetical protein [unclassified Breznakia]|uniref:hypothetical protein n=1 Tax=unclassified Breznakia TaxID=2623764 RepID=UPI0024768E71|nr:MULTISPECIES: hypothetical protein [unclassified Breznakia]MDH6366684.1 hypothetical protein [Breznakia sp. PH1-1]MDH6403777.1 hypothetical protein [Breznakia sp. PF1-11]MDH6411486.1 hypothetical protein [Breznakia sp. PFB1-11]MDH6413783.1 hypothetical protein [Breznakia sp. PFB1-14]MDH6416213.1 hypothetical protein [Breznakia sp. PFB1-4]